VGPRAYLESWRASGWVIVSGARVALAARHNRRRAGGRRSRRSIHGNCDSPGMSSTRRRSPSPTSSPGRRAGDGKDPRVPAAVIRGLTSEAAASKRLVMPREGPLPLTLRASHAASSPRLTPSPHSPPRRRRRHGACRGEPCGKKAYAERLRAPRKPAGSKGTMARRSRRCGSRPTRSARRVATTSFDVDRQAEGVRGCRRSCRRHGHEEELDDLVAFIAKG
jgi:hypothetical protein